MVGFIGPTLNSGSPTSHAGGLPGGEFSIKNTPSGIRTGGRPKHVWDGKSVKESPPNKFERATRPNRKGLYSIVLALSRLSRH